ncbi:MAG: hydantoinase B/oxoprolinase family protein [Gemmatimonadota bacterium]
MQRTYAHVDGVRLEVYRHLFTALAEQMGAALRGAAYSPNIKERRDYSCALFDGAARVVAMGDHMPVHLGAMPMSVAAAIEELRSFVAGDVVALNDPFRGGTHLPDITMVRPVLLADATPVAYLAVRAHHADVGGMTPGSMPLAREIYQEGLRIPPVKLVRAGRRDDDLWRMVLANVRTPREREGDLAAQTGCLEIGERRLRELVERRGLAEVLAAMAALVTYGERLVRAGVALIPDGVYEAEDQLEDDGCGAGPLPIRVRIAVAGETLAVDFEGSAPQAAGGVNAVAAITVSCVRYVVRCLVEALLEQTLPAGGGPMSCVHVHMPQRSIVDAAPPASVAAGNVETSQRITDVLLAAFAQALPDLVPAQSQGTMNNITLGGSDPRDGLPFAYYETIGGGMGAAASGAGLSGVHVHMSNSLNTPIEAIEHALPIRIRHYALRRESGGTGRQRGGDGIRRDIEFLADAEVSILSERRLRSPRGAAGGGAGAAGVNLLISGAVEETLPSKVTVRVRAGDRLSIRTPGGGGYGTGG